MMSIDYLGEWRRTHYSADITPSLDGKEVVIFGWVQRIRDLGGIRFLVLRDKKGTVQITIPRATVSPSVLEKADSLQKESTIGIRGIVKKMEKAPQGAEIIPKEIKILGMASPPLSLDVSGRIPAELDTRLDARILDLRRSESQAIFRIRHHVLSAIRQFFIERGFIEVQTPKIIASATEGGAALFPIAYYEKEAFLAQSPQLYKEQLVSVFEKVFEIGPIFRAEKFHTTRHLCEVTSVDMEEAFVDAEDVMKTAEEMIAWVIKYVKENFSKELEILKSKIEVPKTPFERYTYDEVLKELERRGIVVVWGEDLSSEALRILGRIHKGFYFIKDWPTQSKPFYMMPYPDKPELCQAFDVMYGWLEIASGGTRIHSRPLLEKRLKEQGLSPEAFQFHLKTFDLGMPPHAGWGLGLERFLMVLTGRKNIQELSLFPRTRKRLIP